MQVIVSFYSFPYSCLKWDFTWFSWIKFSQVFWYLNCGQDLSFISYWLQLIVKYVYYLLLCHHTTYTLFAFNSQGYFDLTDVFCLRFLPDRHMTECSSTFCDSSNLKFAAIVVGCKGSVTQKNQTSLDFGKGLSNFPDYVANHLTSHVRRNDQEFFWNNNTHQNSSWKSKIMSGIQQF